MTPPISEIERRRRAVQATADVFQDHPFEWGKYDCAKMVLAHLRNLGIRIKVRKAGEYHSAAGARAALKRLGFDSLDAIADAHFERIPAASAILGDLVLVDADSPIGALGIHLGNRSVMVYHEDAPGGPIAGRLEEAKGAWRVIHG